MSRITIATASKDLLASKLGAVRGIVKRTLKWQQGLAEELAALGLTTRALARPYVLVVVAEMYNVSHLEEGQRGLKLPRDSAAEKALTDFLAAAFGSDNPFKGAGKGSNDSVEIPAAKVNKVRRAVLECGITSKKELNALLRAVREGITFA